MHDPHSALATVRVAGEPYQLLTSGQLQTQLNDKLPAPLPHDHHQVMAVVDTIASTLTDNAPLKAALGGEVDRTRLLNAIRYGKLKVFAGEVLPEHWFPMTRTVAPETAPDATPPVTPQIAPEQAGTGRDITCWLYRTEIAHPHPDTQHQVRFRDVGWSPADEAARTQHTARSCLAMTETNRRRRARVSLVVRANGSSPPFVYPLGEGLPGVEKTRDPGPVATTLMPVVPVVNDSEASVPDEGWIYIFRHNRLWRMLKTAPGGVFHDSHHELARKHNSAPHADGLGLRAIWVPLQINGQKESSLDMLYSPTLLPWDQVTGYEADPAKRLEVSTDLTPLTAWVNDQTVPDAFVLPEGLEDRPASAAVQVVPLPSAKLRIRFETFKDQLPDTLYLVTKFDDNKPQRHEIPAKDIFELDIPPGASVFNLTWEHPRRNLHWRRTLRDAPHPDTDNTSSTNDREYVFLSRLNIFRVPPIRLHELSLRREAWSEEECLPDPHGSVDSYSEIGPVWDMDTLTNRPLADGWLYLFRDGYLWAEYKVEATGDQREYYPVNLQLSQGQDKRQPQARPGPVLAPADTPLELAYSRVQWSWARINALGGLRPDAAPDEPDWPFYDPASGAPLANEDNRLVDPSPVAAAKRREARCLKADADQREVILPDPEGLLHTAAMRLNTAWSLMEQLVADMAEKREADFGAERYLDAAILTWSWLHQPPPQNAASPWARDKAHYLQQQRLQASVDENEIRRILKVDARQTLRELIRSGRASVVNVLRGDVGAGGSRMLACALWDRLAPTSLNTHGLPELLEILALTLGRLSLPETLRCRTLQLDEAIVAEHQSATDWERLHHFMSDVFKGNHPLSGLLKPWSKPHTWRWQSDLAQFISLVETTWSGEDIPLANLMQKHSAWQKALASVSGHSLEDNAGLAKKMYQFVDMLSDIEVRHALASLAKKGESVTLSWVRQHLAWSRNMLAAFGSLLIHTGDYSQPDARSRHPLASALHSDAQRPSPHVHSESLRALQVTPLGDAARNAFTSSGLGLFSLNAWLAVEAALQAPDTRNMLSLASNTLDLIALGGKKSLEALARKLGEHAVAPTSWLPDRGLGSRWSRCFSRGLPVVGNALDLTIAIMDGARARRHINDSAKAFMLQAQGHTIGLLSVIAANPALGVAALGVVITGMVLQYFVWKDSTPVELFLSHGPFAARQPEAPLPVFDDDADLRPPPGVIQKAPLTSTRLGGLYQFKYMNEFSCLAIARMHGHNGKTLRLLLQKPGLLLTLDEHYRLIGLMDYEIPARPNLRQVIRLTGDGTVYLKQPGSEDHKLGRFGEPLAESLDELLASTAPWRTMPETTSARDMSGRLSATGTPEYWYIAPIRQSPHAALELLVSGLYPIEISSMEATTARATPADSQRHTSHASESLLITRVKVPLFLEGQSRLFLQYLFAEAGAFASQAPQGIVRQQDPMRPDATYRQPEIEIASLINLPTWQASSGDPGLYVDTQTQELVHVQVISAQDLKFIWFESGPASDSEPTPSIVTIIARARVALTNGHSPATLGSQEILNVPFRGRYAFGDGDGDGDDEDETYNESLCWSTQSCEVTFG